MTFLNAKKLFYNRNFKLLVAVISLIALTIYFVNEFNKTSGLQNILNQNLSGKKNIFFVVTSFSNTKDEVSLEKRDKCSIESAALLNPNAQIHVIFITSSTLISSDTRELGAAYKNIAFHRTEISEFSLDTPIEDWIKSGALYNSKFLIQNISNLMRLLLLWK